MKTKTPIERPAQNPPEEQGRIAVQKERLEDAPPVSPPPPRWKTITDPPRV